MTRRFDSVEFFFRLQDGFDRAFPWVFGFTVLFVAPIFAAWVEGR